MLDSVFILTLGEKGSILYTQNIKIKLSAIKIKTKDTVGAGDCYIAGIIYYLEQFNSLKLKDINSLSKENWINCLRFATVVSAKNCLKEGCDPPYIKDIKKFMKFQK